MSSRSASRRLVPAVTVAALATLALGASSLAAAPAQQRVALRLNLVERIASQHFVDLGKHGPSVGDHNVTRSDVLDPSGARVGRADIDCTLTGVGRNMGGLCHGVVTLRDGQIVSEFAFGPSGGTRVAAVVGGTGAYAGARGVSIVDVHGTDEHEPFTIELFA
jgi:hypothetical protein